MDNNRFLKTVIIILLLINIGTLAFMWLNKQAIILPPPHEKGDVFEFLTHELKLNDQQRNQYDQIRREHHNNVEALQEKGRDTHDRFFELLHNKSADSTLVSQLSDSISAIQKQIELLTFYHFQKVREICSSEQQKKFDEVIGEALKMMSPKPPPPRR